MALLVDDHWVEEVGEIKKEAVRHFSSLFSEVVWRIPVLDRISFPSVSPAENSDLIGTFSLEEVELAVESCDGNKCLGSDGFHLNFIQNFWDTVKGDVLGMVQEFYVHAKLTKGITSYFLALIPKRDNPQRLGDFRPISLLG